MISSFLATHLKWRTGRTRCPVSHSVSWDFRWVLEWSKWLKVPTWADIHWGIKWSAGKWDVCGLSEQPVDALPLQPTLLFFQLNGVQLPVTNLMWLPLTRLNSKVTNEASVKNSKSKEPLKLFPIKSSRQLYHCLNLDRICLKLMFFSNEPKGRNSLGIELTFLTLDIKYKILQETLQNLVDVSLMFCNRLRKHEDIIHKHEMINEDVVNNSLKHGGSNGKYKKVFEMIVCSVCSIVNCWCISLLKYIDFFFYFIWHTPAFCVRQRRVCCINSLMSMKIFRIIISTFNISISFTIYPYQTCSVTLSLIWVDVFLAT